METSRKGGKRTVSLSYVKHVLVADIRQRKGEPIRPFVRGKILNENSAVMDTLEAGELMVKVTCPWCADTHFHKAAVNRCVNGYVGAVIPVCADGDSRYEYVVITRSFKIKRMAKWERRLLNTDGYGEEIKKIILEDISYESSGDS